MQLMRQHGSYFQTGDTELRMVPGRKLKIAVCQGYETWESALTKSFKELRESGCVYVDKTEQIFRLLMTMRTFISRPHGFGKSLLLDTIATLLESGVDPYFRDTWIHDRWTEPKYPVLRLDFSDFTGGYEGFCRKYTAVLESFAQRLGISGEFTPDDRPCVALFELLHVLNDHDFMIVILIDEYDAPLRANLNNPELFEKFRAELYNLSCVLKGDPCIQYLCIAGVTRFRDPTPTFSGTDVHDESYDSSAAGIAGFTREELVKYFRGSIDRAVSSSKGIPEEDVTDEQREELLDSLSEECGGYCFDETGRVKVYSPFSVIRFFRSIAGELSDSGSFRNERTGRDPVLADCLKSHGVRLSDILTDGERTVCGEPDFRFPESILSMNPKVLLCQYGYLTLDSDLRGFNLALKVPNREAQAALERVFS